MLRLRCGLSRRRVEDDALVVNDADVDEETRERNRRARALRLAQARGENEEQVMRRMLHESLLGRYGQLIPVIDFNKELDEFNIPECVICME